jgi:hypothetical protein
MRLVHVASLVLLSGCGAAVGTVVAVRGPPREERAR